MSKALLSSVTGQWVEISDDVAAVSDKSRVADIVETDIPAVTETDVLETSLVDVDGKPTRVHALRKKTVEETRTYLRPLAFVDKLGDTLLVELCAKAQQDPVIFAMLLRLSSALYLESDDPALNGAVDMLISMGVKIDKTKLFTAWDKRPPIGNSEVTDKK